MSSILSPTDRQRIAALVAEVERRTAGELMVVVSVRAAAYDRTRAAWAAMLTWTATVAAYVLVPSVSAAWLIAAQAPVAWGLFWLFGFPLCVRSMVPSQVLDQAVQRRARELFVELGVTETRGRSGVLVFIGEAERRVVILADRGIHQHVGTRGWQQYVDQLVEAIRSRRAREGIEATITRIGAELAAKFPAQPDDVNELPDEVVVTGS